MLLNYFKSLNDCKKNISKMPYMSNLPPKKVIEKKGKNFKLMQLSLYKSGLPLNAILPYK